MDFSDLKSAIILGFFMSFMIGPVFFMLIQTSILKGVRAAISFNLGVISGDVSFILIAYFGSKSLLEKIKDDPRLFFVGGLILIVYGVIVFFSKKNKDDNLKTTDLIKNTSQKKDCMKFFLKGFFLNFINVGVLVFWLGTIVIVGPTLDMSQRLVFCYFSVVLVTYFLTDVVKILLAKYLKNKLTPTLVIQIKKAMGFILAFFGLILLVKSFIPNILLENLLKFF